jgi:hypothetical protein
MRAASRCAALAAILLAAACARTTGPAASASPPGEWRTFEGTWTAAGLRRTLELGPEHRASVFDMTGSVLLVGERRLGVGFQARVLGFTDDVGGMWGRSVWTDERGEQVYSDLTGERTATGNRITGTFRGGTGRYAGVTGEYSFQWRYLLESEDGAVSGRAIDLEGRARLPAADAPAAPATEQADP